MPGRAQTFYHMSKRALVRHSKMPPLSIVPRGDLSRPARHPWALHIAGCIWQSGQLRLLAGRRGVSMHVGLVMECDYRDGRTQEEAFAEAFSIIDIAEEYGIDGVWLAERHFAGPRRPTDPMGGGIPSIASVPLVLAAAIAARTKRVRIGTGVSVLPLCHPVRLAEEAATVDQISRGRFVLGVGRGVSPRACGGWGAP